MKDGMRHQYLELALTRHAQRGMKWALKAERFRDECPPGGHELKAPIVNPGAKKGGREAPSGMKVTSKRRRTK